MDKKQRLAVEISGEFRSLHLCVPSLQKNLLESFPNVQIDFFIHTWERNNDGFGTWPIEGRGEWHKQVVVFSHKSGLNVFQPVLAAVERYENCSELQTLPRPYSMFYSIRQANLIRKQYENTSRHHYDLVMRYRTDCILNEPLYDIIKEYITEEKPFLCIPKAKQPKYPDGPCENELDGICDWMAIGTPDMMDIYCGTYDSWISTKIKEVPECMLAKQLRSNDITRETTLKRPVYDMFLVEGNGKVRGV